jgi:hypothetical protein
MPCCGTSIPTRYRQPEATMTPVRPTHAERDLVLAGLFELTIICVADDKQRERCRVLAARLGGDPGAMFDGAPLQELRR